MSRHSFAVFISFMLAVAVFVPAAQAHWLIDANGNLTYSDRVLGDNEDSEDQEDSPEVEQEDSHEDDSEDSTELEVEGENGQSQGETNREREKIKIKYQSPDIKYELESENGKLKIKTKTTSANGTETEEETEVEADILEVDQPNSRFSLKIATGSGSFKYFFKTKTAAKTDFPLAIGENNELIVTTPAGTKVVTILPDQAVANMLAGKHIDRVVSSSDDEEGGENEATGSGTPSATSSGELEQEGVESVVELTDDNGEPVYVVEGESDQRVLGLFPTHIKRRLIVSAQDGELVRQEFDSFFARLLDIISF